MGGICIKAKRKGAYRYEINIPDNWTRLGIYFNRNLIYQLGNQWNNPHYSFCFHCFIHSYLKYCLGINFSILCWCNYSNCSSFNCNLRVGVWNCWIHWSCYNNWSLCWLCCTSICHIHPYSLQWPAWKNETSIHWNGCQHIKWNTNNLWIRCNAIRWLIYNLLKVCCFNNLHYSFFIFYVNGAFWCYHAYYGPLKETWINIGKLENWNLRKLSKA